MSTRMHGTALAILALGGLGGCFGVEDDGAGGGMGRPEPVVQGEGPEPTALPAPGPCGYDVSLHGMNGNGSATIGPLSLDTAGVTICMNLDATDNIWVGHYGASTWREDAPASTFRLTLFDAQDNLIVDGWDVAFGSSPTRVFASLEYGVTKGTVLQAKLVARTLSGTATTEVSMSLFEPYE